MVKTTLAWKYVPVKLEDLTPEDRQRLEAVGEGQVPTTESRRVQGLLWRPGALSRLVEAHPQLVVSPTPWGLRQLQRVITPPTAGGDDALLAGEED